MSYGAAPGGCQRPAGLLSSRLRGLVAPLARFSGGLGAAILFLDERDRLLDETPQLLVVVFILELRVR